MNKLTKALILRFGLVIIALISIYLILSEVTLFRATEKVRMDQNFTVQNISCEKTDCSLLLKSAGNSLKFSLSEKIVKEEAIIKGKKLRVRVNFNRHLEAETISVHKGENILPIKLEDFSLKR